MAKKLTPTQKEKNRLQRHIRSQVKKLNKRRGALLRENARLGRPSDAVDDELMETWRARTKTVSKNKLSTGRLSNMSLKTLQNLSGFIDEYAGVKDKSGKMRGSHYKHYNKNERMAMERKALETFNANHYLRRKQAIDAYAAARGVKPDYGDLKPMTRSQYRRMTALFSSNELATLVSAGLLPSDQIVEMGKKISQETFDNLPQAIDSLYTLFGGKTKALKPMKQFQQKDPVEFRQLLQAYMLPADKQQEALMDIDIYRELTGK